jgi:2'-5' RNA ligase
VRLFLAINFPADVRRAIVGETAPLREAAPELSWVTEPRIHLTLKFLDEQPAERVPEIQAVAEEVAARHKSLTMSLGGVGAFPNFRRARVVWMGVAQEPRLELLHHDIEVAFERLGFELEGRAFRPHLTLARIKHPLPEERLRVLSRAAKQMDFETEFLVRSVDLMRSELSTTGPAYTTLASAALRSD